MSGPALDWNAGDRIRHISSTHILRLSADPVPIVEKDSQVLLGYVLECETSFVFTVTREALDKEWLLAGTNAAQWRARLPFDN